jgi:hypothetical protein
MKSISTLLPDLYQRFLPAEVLELSVRESLATCDNCVQAKRGARPQYHPELKCCTFYPILVNYLVGGVLGDPSGSTGALIRRQIEQGQFVMPVGLGPSPAYQWRYVNKRQEEFGNNSEFLCPYFQRGSGGCSIWQYRSSECRSFFCISEAGAAGEEFWRRFNEMLYFVEINLSQAYLLERGFLPIDFRQQMSLLRRSEFKDGDGTNWYLSEIERQKIWDHWWGREVEFFLGAADWVRSLSPTEWQKEFGPEFKPYVEAVRESFRRTTWKGTRSHSSQSAKPSRDASLPIRS